MIKRIYNINTKKVFIYCEIDEYCNKIENWMNIYDYDNYNRKLTEDYNYFIKIYNNKIVWSISSNKKVINKKINSTDLYPLFYNLLANIING